MKQVIQTGPLTETSDPFHGSTIYFTSE